MSGVKKNSWVEQHLVTLVAENTKTQKTERNLLFEFRALQKQNGIRKQKKENIWKPEEQHFVCLSSERIKNP